MQLEQPSPFPSHFYLDIIHTIIDFLGFDKITLAACSLVCSDWRNRSQTHLLHTLLLRDQQQLSTFIAAIPSMSLPFLSHPRELRVRSLWTTPPESWLTITRTEFSLLLGSLSMVHTVLLDYVRLECSGDTLTSRTRSLDLLSFRDIGGPSPAFSHLSSILAFISLFRRIRYLFVSHDRCRSVPPIPEIGTICPESACGGLQVEEFTAESYPFETFLAQFLLRYGNAETLRKIRITPGTMLPLRPLFATFPGIVELSVNFAYWCIRDNRE